MSKTTAVMESRSKARPEAPLTLSSSRKTRLPPSSLPSFASTPFYHQNVLVREIRPCHPLRHIATVCLANA